MTEKPNDIVLIFGRSPYINEIKDLIPALCEKYHTIGINYFVNSFPCVENVCFYDDIVPKVAAHHHLIVSKRHAENPMYQSFKLINGHENKEVFEVKHNVKDFQPAGSGALSFVFHTPTMALNWAYQRGFKRAVLIGIDLERTRHFDANSTPDAAIPRWREEDLQRAKDYLKTINSRYVKLHKTNAKNTIEVELNDINDVLRGVFLPSRTVTQEVLPTDAAHETVKKKGKARRKKKDETGVGG